jgi:hypothetical protein
VTNHHTTRELLLDDVLGGTEDALFHETRSDLLQQILSSARTRLEKDIVREPPPGKRPKPRGNVPPSTREESIWCRRFEKAVGAALVITLLVLVASACGSSFINMPVGAIDSRPGESMHQKEEAQGSLSLILVGLASLILVKSGLLMSGFTVFGWQVSDMVLRFIILDVDGHTLNSVLKWFDRGFVGFLFLLLLYELEPHWIMEMLRFFMCFFAPSATSFDLEEEFRKRIGSRDIKTELRTIRNRFNQDKRDGKAFVLDKHLVLTGSPGTGKTSWARLYAKILHSTGVIKNPNYIEIIQGKSSAEMRHGSLVERHATELIGTTVGSAGDLVRKAAENAKGGVLFIDEAYMLASDDKFGKAAIESLMLAMDRNTCIVIFAGYRDKMKQFREVNEGLFRRLQWTIHLPDFTIDEAATIVENKLALGKPGLSSEVNKSHIRSDFRTSCKQRMDVLKRSNAGIADRIYENASNARANRNSNARNYENASNAAGSATRMQSGFTRADIETGIQKAFDVSSRD